MERPASPTLRYPLPGRIWRALIQIARWGAAGTGAASRPTAHAPLDAVRRNPHLARDIGFAPLDAPGRHTTLETLRQRHLI